MNLKARAFLSQAITFLVMALLLFVPAGTTAWFAAWAYLILFFVYGAAITLWLLKKNPGLLEERMRSRPQKTWDKVFIAVLFVVFLVWLVLMPLDAVRFHWSRMAAWLQVVGAIVLSCSYYIFYLTFRENPFLSGVVRVQKDRGQTVVSTGPYRHVRHPMYAGAFLYFLGNGPFSGFLVWGAFRADIRLHACRESGTRGTPVARTAQRLRRLHGAGEIPFHPACLVIPAAVAEWYSMPYKR